MRICCIHVLVFQKTLPETLRPSHVFEAQPGPSFFEKCIRCPALSLLGSDYCCCLFFLSLVLEQTRQDLEILVLELKFFKTNWLVIGTYKPPSLSDIAFTSEISNILTFYRSTHDNILLMGDFNMTPNNPKLSELIADHELCALISEPTSKTTNNIILCENNQAVRRRFVKSLIPILQMSPRVSSFSR